MAGENPSTLFFFLVGIHLLLGCCPVSSLPFTNHSDGGGGPTIEGDVASSSRTARQLLMSAIYPYYTASGLFTNFQQRPPNFLDQWLRSPSNVSTVSSDGKLFDEALSSARQQQEYPCGRGPAKLPTRTTVGIIGGSEADPNSWPFIVALRNKGNNFCGGSLISPDKVLTAAHCVEKKTSYDISVMTVSLGMHTVGDGETTKDDSQMTRRFSKVVMHNGYNAVTLVNDIAILTLESPVVYSDVISPVCLAPYSNDPDQYAGQNVAIIGWGRTSPSEVDNIYPDTLQQATIKAMTNQKCKKQIPILTNNMFCLKDDDKAVVKGTCNGDSGGPVIVQSATGAWTQVGIVSYGVSYCGIFPSINTRVSAYRSWIINNM